MTQIIFYKCIQFPIELLVAEFLFTFRLARRRCFLLRYIAVLAVCAAVFVFFPLPSENAFYVSFMYLALFAVTVAAHKFAYKERWIIILFCCVAGYTVQHFAYELYNIVLNLLGAADRPSMNIYGSGEILLFSNPLIAMAYLYIYIASYFFLYFFFGRRIKVYDISYLKNSFIFIFVILILIVDIILNAFVISYLSSPDKGPYFVVVGIYNMLCCLFGLYLQFEAILRRQSESMLNAVKQLWAREKQQYEISKENIGLINMKCHDMKHRIMSIGGRELSNESVKEISELISVYDSVVKTGNEVLDIILTEKSLMCAKNNIKFNVIADGKSLDFIRDDDLYSLFGNIVDNATEAVMQLDEERRVIGINIKATDMMVSVNEHNYYGHELNFENGLPQTTKEDRANHGYGMQSIRFICEKYKGDMQINAENGIFNLNILFPRGD